MNEQVHNPDTNRGDDHSDQEVLQCIKQVRDLRFGHCVLSYVGCLFRRKN